MGVRSVGTVHRGAFGQFPFRWIYYYGSNKFTGKETGKTHLSESSGVAEGLNYFLFKRLTISGFFLCLQKLKTGTVRGLGGSPVFTVSQCELGN